MKKIPCLYAVARFTPFVETGEFANIGIVLIAPQHGVFGFKLMRKRYARVTQFFDQLDRRVYLSAVAALNEELDRLNGFLIKQGFDARNDDNNARFAQQMFMELVRPREAVIRFGELRTVLAEDPLETLDSLYGFYIERDFVSHEHGEALMTRQIRKVLVDAQLGKRFHAGKVGDSAFHVQFPFVEERDQQPIKIIKPLRLNHDEPSMIRDHGLQWLTRLVELKRHNRLPDQVLFAVDEVDDAMDAQGDRREACDDIEARLIEQGVQVTSCKQTNVILEFAQG